MSDGASEERSIPEVLAPPTAARRRGRAAAANPFVPAGRRRPTWRA
jgi:hypothetical protein